MDIKQASFVLLVLLVSVSGVYEWARTDAVVGEQLSMGTMTAFSSSTLENNVSTVSLAVTNIITAISRTDLIGFIGALINLFVTTFEIFMRLMFGWIDLVAGIFDSVGLRELEVVFIGPIAIIELFALFYFLRDLVNTVRGVG